MTTTVKLILAQPLIAGAPPTVGHVMGNRMLHRGAFAQGSATTLGLDLGTELLLELLVLADGQAAAVPEPGGGTLRPHGPETGCPCLGASVQSDRWDT